MRHALSIATLLCLSNCSPTQATSKPEAPQRTTDPPVLVDTDWLVEHLRDTGLVIIHVGQRATYDQEHIPGARYLGWRDVVREHDGLTAEMPPRTELVARFEALGISDRSRIVLYSESRRPVLTARVYVALATIGLAGRTSVLDGGFSRWKSRGQTVTAEVPQVATGSITARTADVLADRNAVTDASKAPTTVVVDARDAIYYHGLGRGPYPRAGRIPGAVSIPYTSVIDSDGGLLDKAALRALFADAGIGPDADVVTYCHVGLQASLVLLAARHIGLSARMYDGSYQQWSNSSAPVVAGAPPRPISTAELAAMQSREAPVVLDMRRSLAAYLADHIPGAAWLHVETLRMTSAGVPAATHDGAHYAAIFSRLGVDLERPVVIYPAGVDNAVDATFAAWILSGFGHRRTYVLDGGYARWRAEKRPVTRDYPTITPTSLSANQFGLPMLATDMVHRMHRSDEVVVVDARPTAQFTGAAGPQMRRGHIPGAISHPWRSDLNDAGPTSAWLDVETLRARYRAQGITRDKTVIAYCNTGTEASHLFVTLTGVLGYPNVFVYVPSWTAWAARADLPVATGEAPPAARSAP